MDIRPNESAVESVQRSEPDGRRYRSPEWGGRGDKHPGEGRKRSAEADVLSINLSNSFSRNESGAAIAALGNIISLSQTQAGLLGRAQAALNRMSALAVLSGESSVPEEERREYSAEFRGLQQFLRELEGKSFAGAPLFGRKQTELLLDLKSPPVELDSIDLNLGAEDVTRLGEGSLSLDSPAEASGAAAPIQAAMEKLNRLRGEVEGNLLRLNRALEALLASETGLTPGEIRDQGLAEKRLESALGKIAAEAGQVFLAQANLLPESALRLLRPE